MAHIKTYARLKPGKKPSENYSVTDNVLTIHILENKDSLISLGSQPNRGSVTYDIRFDNIFVPESTQEDVFETVAKNIIENFLLGYNGTIFAYGQTGTGKTYTVEGSSSRYQARGLATRALSMIYKELEKRTDEDISVYLSYIEIYQEVAYDLLNPGARTMLPVVPFSKVSVVEGPSGACIMRGLSLHLAANESVAQMLLMQGQANRKVAETPVNQRSSRSHSVFSVYLQARKKDSQVIISSKLHLVDLAGSERVSKTGVDGQQLTEAKSINLSLHHLETVIICLQSGGGSDDSQSQQQRASSGESNPIASRSSTTSASAASSISSRHIPYRNSLLTMILKDSLGGNCLTAMIATISLEPENIGESLSTCRFAQRVARVANFARRNEEVDDKMLIKKLKMKVAHLETKLARLLNEAEVTTTNSLNEEAGDSGLFLEEEIDCQQVIDEFLQGIIKDPVSAGITTQIRFRQCLQLMKTLMLEHGISSTRHSLSGMGQKSSFISSSVTSSYQNGRDFVFKKQEKAAAVGLDENQWSSIVNHKGEDYATNGSMQPEDKSTCVDSGAGERTPQIDQEHQQHHQKQHKQQQQYQQHHDQHHRQQNSRQNRRDIVSPISDQGMDDIDKLLMSVSSTSGSKSSGYKTPFERKREKKIKKLGKTLLSIEEEKAAQEEELALMKQNTVLESLRMEEEGMRLKLQVADEQVADQHAYILHLKHIESDPELLTKELLVEKQLRKRQMKFQSKLKNVQERRMGVERELSQTTNERGKTYRYLEKKDSRTFEDKYGQFKQNRGSLNTRQVFEMLKNEEKRQKKEIGKFEREKTVMKTKQLELKEMATWEKLRDLKQMLKMSQRQGLPMPQSAPGACVSVLSPWSQNSVNNSGPSTADIEPGHSSVDGPDSFPPNQSHLISQYLQLVQNNIDSKCSDEKKKRKGIVAYYSSDGMSQAWGDSLPQSSNQSSNGHLPPSDNEPCGLSPTISLAENTLLPKSQAIMNAMETDKNNNSEFQLEGLKLGVTDIEMSDNLKLPATSIPSKSDYHFISDNKGNSKESHNLNSASSTSIHKDHLSNSDNFSIERNSPSMDDIMELLTPSTIGQNAKHESQEFSSSQNSPKTHKVLPPSEYINSMTEKERFDARRMGLSSRTFESALSHMLDETDNHINHNVPDLPYSVDVYEKYTRKSSSTNLPQHKHRASKVYSSHDHTGVYSVNKPKNSHPHQNKKTTIVTEKREKIFEERSTWGPDVKNVSVADRLSGLFDDTPSDFLPAHHTAKHQGEDQSSITDGVDSWQQEDTSFHLGLEPLSGGVIVDESCNEEDTFFGQQTPRFAITALKKEEGEQTFMSRFALERERIAKIRKARHAAEVIQRFWRKYKT